jgi:outer membrane protein TolC
MSSDQLVTQALEHNLSLLASKATLAQAQELALAQAGLRYPQVDLTAGVGSMASERNSVHQLPLISRPRARCCAV